MLEIRVRNHCKMKENQKSRRMPSVQLCDHRNHQEAAISSSKEIWKGLGNRDDTQEWIHRRSFRSRLSPRCLPWSEQASTKTIDPPPPPTSTFFVLCVLPALRRRRRRLVVKISSWFFSFYRPPHKRRGRFENIDPSQDTTNQKTIRSHEDVYIKHRWGPPQEPESRPRGEPRGPALNGGAPPKRVETATKTTNIWGNATNRLWITAIQSVRSRSFVKLGRPVCLPRPRRGERARGIISGAVVSSITLRTFTSNSFLNSIHALFLAPSSCTTPFIIRKHFFNRLISPIPKGA